MRKAYYALHDGGRVIIFSSMSNDAEDGPLMATLDTVDFRSVAAGQGMVYTWGDYERILRAPSPLHCRPDAAHGLPFY